YGKIGFETLIKIIYYPLFENIPKILETPFVNKKPIYKEEIIMIKNKKFNENLKNQ
ncbi:MAG: deoxyribonuclease IV, partial [Candidatus Phytoplasma australasiaticum]|nr:deoxyribonuclease IV [Candidatus Phytoplasma australasiaticum]